MKCTIARCAAALAATMALAVPAARADQDPEGFYYAFQTSHILEAGRLYTIETSHLQRRDSLQLFPAATHILLIDPTAGDAGILVAHAGVTTGELGSRLQFRAPATRTYRIVVTSDTTGMERRPASLGYFLQCGRADLSIRDEDVGFSWLVPGISFCGQGHYIEHHAGECFRANAGAPNTNPYIFYISTEGYTDIAAGSTVRWNDNTVLQNSELCFDDAGSGWVLDTAAEISGEGPGTIDLVDHTRLLSWEGEKVDWPESTPLSTVFHWPLPVVQNKLYTIYTTHLRKRDTFQGPAPDTVMYVLNKATGRVIARNDDGSPDSLTSSIGFIASETQNYEIVVRARTRYTPGNLDLVVNGAVVARNQPFAGEMLRPFLKDGTINGREDCIETEAVEGKPTFYWFANPSSDADTGGRVVVDESVRAGANARVCFSDFRRLFPTEDIARGMLVIGSSSAASEGNTSFDVQGSNHF